MNVLSLISIQNALGKFGKFSKFEEHIQARSFYVQNTYFVCFKWPSLFIPNLPKHLANVILVSIQEMLGEYFKSGQLQKETQKRLFGQCEWAFLDSERGN